ncbi:MAG: serine/threonine protein kinase [Prochloraceae cyanobacterium]
MESLVGKTLKNGKYLIDRELGQGGFGVTYKAIELKTDEPVVIKTLKKSSGESAHQDKLRKQFLQEANRLFECKHSNIVRYRTFFEEKKQPFIVMDYIPGSTLDELVIPNNPLLEATAIEYTKQIAEALKIVHRKGLLHRDIKPQNLILHSETKQVVLIDFGISREFSQGKTKTHTNLISEGYAPLEQYLPKTKRTAATDVYGLAATLYTLLTAEIPIAPTLRDRIPLRSPQEIRGNISSGVSDAVMAGMAIEAKDRPATIDKWLKLLLNPNNKRVIPVAAMAGTSQYNDLQSARGALPSTAKEQDIYGDYPENKKSAFPFKSILLASMLGFGISFVWSRIEPPSIGIPDLQESIIKKNSSNKQLNSTNSQINRQAQAETKKFAEQAQIDADRDRSIDRAEEEKERIEAVREAQQEKAEAQKRLEQELEEQRQELEAQKREAEAERRAEQRERWRQQQLAAEKRRLWQQEKADREYRQKRSQKSNYRRDREDEDGGED